MELRKLNKGIAPAGVPKNAKKINTVNTIH